MMTGMTETMRTRGTATMTMSHLEGGRMTPLVLGALILWVDMLHFPRDSGRPLLSNLQTRANLHQLKHQKASVPRARALSST